MTSVINKLRRTLAKKAVRKDTKLHGMTDAGLRLLARNDFDALSMAQLAREAGCSVGALYGRFPDKNTYLYHLISSALRSMKHSAETELGMTLWKQLSAADRIKLIVDHTVSEMASPRGAGIIRATMKLATMHPSAMELFEEYRSAVSDCAVTMLSKKTARAPTSGEVRVAMQILFATITDAVLQKKPGPMIAGSGRMKSALTNIMIGYLGLSKKSGWVGAEAQGKDKSADNDLEEEPPAPGEAALFEPDLRAFRRSKIPQVTRSVKSAQPASATAKPHTPVRIPPKAPETKDTKGSPPRPRRRRTVI